MTTARPWPYISKVITKDDLVSAGACNDGVKKRLKILGNPTLIDINQAKDLLSGDSEAEEWIDKAVSLSGDGDGYGYGYGAG